MPEYLAPGAYVVEKGGGNRPIEGVSTSNLGLAGATERGPTSVRSITSFSEFVRTYGGYTQAKVGAGAGATTPVDVYLAYAVEGFFANGGARCFVARVVSDDSATRASTADLVGAGGNALRIDAIGPGTWGDRAAYRIEPASKDPTIRFKLSIAYWRTTPPTLDPSSAAWVPPAVFEVHDDLSADASHLDHCVKRVNQKSSLVTLAELAAGSRPSDTATYVALAGGNDGAALDEADYNGDPNAPPGRAVGLRALEEIDEVRILSVPDEVLFGGTPSLVTEEMVQQCERRKDRFAIINALQSAPAIATHRPPRVSSYAAYYYPWITVYDPHRRREIPIPPSGHVAGIYARVDIDRGVHKAPANELVQGARNVHLQITNHQQDVLNAQNVNCIREFPGRGIRVWGARSTALDAEWKYVNVRRFFIFIEQSISKGTQWVVFEPNDEPTWARVRRSVTDFLTGVWRDGALPGATSAEAFFVKCDRTTMTQDDIDAGRLIMLIGVAPVKPAEFVIIRIRQRTVGSE